MTSRDQHARSSPARASVYVAPPDRLITTPFVVVTLAAFSFFVYIGALIPIVPLFIEGPIRQGEFAVGVNAAVFAIAAVVSRPFIGRIADARGRRLVIVGGAIIAAVGAFGIGQSDTLAVLLVFRAFTGVGEAAVFVGSATLIADLSPAARRAEGASYFSIAVFTGLGLGPVLGEWLLQGFALRAHVLRRRRVRTACRRDRVVRATASRVTGRSPGR